MYETYCDILRVPQLYDAGRDHVILEAIWVEVGQEGDMVWGEEKALAYGASADFGRVINEITHCVVIKERSLENKVAIVLWNWDGPPHIFPSC